MDEMILEGGKIRKAESLLDRLINMESNFRDVIVKTSFVASRKERTDFLNQHPEKRYKVIIRVEE